VIDCTSNEPLEPIRQPSVFLEQGPVRVFYDLILHTLNSMREFSVLLDSLPYLRGDETHSLFPSFRKSLFPHTTH